MNELQPVELLPLANTRATIETNSYREKLNLNSAIEPQENAENTSNTIGNDGTKDLEWDRVFAVAGAILDEAQISVLKTAAIPTWNKARLEELAAKAK